MSEELILKLGRWCIAALVLGQLREGLNVPVLCEKKKRVSTVHRDEQASATNVVGEFHVDLHRVTRGDGDEEEAGVLDDEHLRVVDSACVRVRSVQVRPGNLLPQLVQFGVEECLVALPEFPAAVVGVLNADALAGETAQHVGVNLLREVDGGVALAVRAGPKEIGRAHV